MYKKRVRGEYVKSLHPLSPCRFVLPGEILGRRGQGAETQKKARRSRQQSTSFDAPWLAKGGSRSLAQVGLSSIMHAHHEKENPALKHNGTYQSALEVDCPAGRGLAYVPLMRGRWGWWWSARKRSMAAILLCVALFRMKRGEVFPFSLCRTCFFCFAAPATLHCTTVLRPILDSGKRSFIQ